MNVQAPFGFVTGCHSGDRFMVQATLASMRYYCPEVPICLIVDGDFDVSDLEKQYDLILLRISDIASDEIRSLTEKSTRSKLAAIWEGPFEFFVWLDSDALVWGDFTPQIQTELDFQIFWDGEPLGRNHPVPDWLSHFYFDPELLRYFDPIFEWGDHAYFCDGTFGCRRGSFSTNEWRELLKWRESEKNPWPTGFNCMPMMNYLVYSKSTNGLNVGMTNLQHIPLHHGDEEVKSDIANSGWDFPTRITRPRCLHFCGKKPYLFSGSPASRAFTIARIQHYRETNSTAKAWLHVINEEKRIISRKLNQKLRRIRRKEGK